MKLSSALLGLFILAVLAEAIVTVQMDSTLRGFVLLGIGAAAVGLFCWGVKN